MAIFTVHLPPTADPARIVLVRDGFSFAAFLFGPLWLLWNRAWIAAAAWTLLLALIGFLAWKLALPRSLMAWTGLVLGCWLGLEGGRLIAWTLARGGYVEDGVVIGDTLDEAEEAFFHRWRAAAPRAHSGERGV